MEMKRTVNGKEFIVAKESTSNRNASAHVDGSVIRIRIPVGWPREQGFKTFLRLEKRVLRQLERNPSRFNASKPLAFKDEQEVTVLGKRFVLQKQLGRGEKTSSAHLDGETIVVRLSPQLSPSRQEEVFSNLARRVIAAAIYPVVERRVRALNDCHIQGPLSRVFIKENKTNFGSCSAKGNVNLSFRVFFAPSEVLDYLIIHELAHLKEQNHSVDFWAIVGKAIPDYRDHVEWLKDHGHSLGGKE